MISREQIAELDEIAYMLKAISNGTRLCVIAVLTRHEEMSVTELAAMLACEQSLLSHHLTDMRAKGILTCRREGKKCYYSLADKKMSQILACMKGCQQAPSFKE